MFLTIACGTFLHLEINSTWNQRDYLWKCFLLTYSTLRHLTTFIRTALLTVSFKMSFRQIFVRSIVLICIQESIAIKRPWCLYTTLESATPSQHNPRSLTTTASKTHLINWLHIYAITTSGWWAVCTVP